MEIISDVHPVTSKTVAGNQGLLQQALQNIIEGVKANILREAFPNNTPRDPRFPAVLEKSLKENIQITSKETTVNAQALFAKMAKAFPAVVGEKSTHIKTSQDLENVMAVVYDRIRSQFPTLQPLNFQRESHSLGPNHLPIDKKASRPAPAWIGSCVIGEKVPELKAEFKPLSDQLSKRYELRAEEASPWVTFAQQLFQGNMENAWMIARDSELSRDIVTSFVGDPKEHQQKYKELKMAINQNNYMMFVGVMGAVLVDQASNKVGGKLFDGVIKRLSKRIRGIHGALRPKKSSSSPEKLDQLVNIRDRVENNITGVEIPTAWETSLARFKQPGDSGGSKTLFDSVNDTFQLGIKDVDELAKSKRWGNENGEPGKPIALGNFEELATLRDFYTQNSLDGNFKINFKKPLDSKYEGATARVYAAQLPGVKEEVAVKIFNLEEDFTENLMNTTKAIREGLDNDILGRALGYKNFYGFQRLKDGRMAIFVRKISKGKELAG